MAEWSITSLPESDRQRIKANLERMLSRIYSDKYECKVTFKFEKKSDVRE